MPRFVSDHEQNACARSVNPCAAGPTNSGLCNPDRYNWWTYYWQEGRHPYYSALPAGDGAEMLVSLYRTYARTLPLHQARVRSWYNHSGVSQPAPCAPLKLTIPRQSDFILISNYD